MGEVDYEAEYNTRGRVPDSAAIIARWTKEAQAFRAAASEAGRAELDVGYGASPRQIIDIFRPQRDAGLLAAFIHGGYWRALEPASFSHLAQGLNARGVTVAMIGYDLCPTVGVRDIVAQVRAGILELWRRFGRPVFVCGHSAGGHIAACLVATDWPSVSPGAPRDVVSAGYGISGVYDLEPLRHTSINADIGLDRAQAHRLSPLYWSLPPGRSFDAVVGGDESGEFIRQSRAIAESWNKSGAAVRWETLPGKNHFTVVAAMTDPHSAMVNRMVELARG